MQLVRPNIVEMAVRMEIIPDRPRGMSKEQVGKQFSKDRASDSHGQTRVNEYSMDKRIKLREMVAYAIKTDICHALGY